MLAVLRPNDLDWPLFLHVVGAMLLVGTLLATLVVLLADRRRRQAGQESGLARLGAGILFLGVVPSYILMRVGAEWIYSRENFVDDPDWIGIGYITADAGFVFIVVMLVLTGIATRRARRAGGGALFSVTGVLASILLLAYVVAVWAMTAKPGS